MRQTADSLRRAGKTIGFVPTMGFLHDGHLSLIRICRKQSEVVVVSIFVNPTQFAPNEDFEQYPRDFDHDEDLCRREGTDILFYPSLTDMYDTNHKTYVTTVDLAQTLCGASRPNHFRGVTTIVTKLFNIVQPHLAVFGQKDAQQCQIIRRMVKDLNFDINIVMGPIIRETDGLAMSSRNKYLNPGERREALVLFKALETAKSLIKYGTVDAGEIKLKMKQVIASSIAAEIDYIAIVAFNTLLPVETIVHDTLIALAVFVGKTRLIDNILIKDSDIPA